MHSSSPSSQSPKLSTLAGPLLGWFFFSSLLSVYNKYIFSSHHKSFPFPLLVTSFHFFVQFAISYVLTSRFPQKFAGHDAIRRMTYRQYLSVAVPCGVVAALDIALSNLSLVTISLTFYTMVKSSAPLFVVLFSHAFGLHPLTPTLGAIVVVIVVGELVTVSNTTKFSSEGFVLCLFAALFAGLRWNLLQLKFGSLPSDLQSQITPLVTLRLLSPVMFFFILTCSLLFEPLFSATSPPPPPPPPPQPPHLPLSPPPRDVRRRPPRHLDGPVRV